MNDPDRHYASLSARDDTAIATVTCGSGAEVTIAPTGGWMTGLVSDGAPLVSESGGPLLIECAEHGLYFGLAQPLERGAGPPGGGSPASMTLLLIPLGEVEYVSLFRD